MKHLKRQPNNSFKPNLLRYTKHMTERACHVFGYATQVGLTQALDRCRKLPVCRTRSNRRATRAVALLNSGARSARTEANLYEFKRESLVVAFDNARAYQFVRFAGSKTCSTKVFGKQVQHILKAANCKPKSIVHRSNNSFKPNLLRGPAHVVAFTTSPMPLRKSA